MKYYLVYSAKHEGYGLFDDLKNRKDVDLIIPRERGRKNKITRLIRNIHLSGTITRFVNLPFKNIWFDKRELKKDIVEPSCVMIVDMALLSFSQKELNELTGTKNVRCVVLLVNSIDSDTMKELGLRSKILKTKWDGVYSYDQNDVEKYGLKSLEYAYYSQHDIGEIDGVPENDAYFIGTLKSSREKQIFSIYKRLKESGVKSEFHLMKLWRERNRSFPYQESIDYYTFMDKTISYSDVLRGDARSNVIIEVLQDNQGGPSLRYFEAVTQNKKLLTNNENITRFPFHNEKYMKVYHNIEDIDVEWMKKVEEVDYGYCGEFSPLRLLSIVMK